VISLYPKPVQTSSHALKSTQSVLAVLPRAQQMAPPLLKELHGRAT